MKNKKSFIAFCLVLIIVVGVPTFIRAATTGITYDEAYSYAYYAKDFNIKQYINIMDNLANNHIINTIMIATTTHLFNIPYNELIIRLPNLIMLILYFIGSYVISYKKKNKYLIFSSLVLNYYVSEFFGLARGYGIATTFILYMLIFYEKAAQNKYDNKNICMSILLGIFACYANTVSIIALISVLLIYFINKIKQKQLLNFIKKNILQIIGFAIAILYIIYYHFTVTGHNKPLFGETGGIFGYFTRSFSWMFIGKPEVIIIINIIVIIVVVLSIIIKKKELLNNSFVVLFFILNILLIIPFIILNKPFLVERCLVPFWPIIAIGMCEIVNMFPMKKEIKMFMECIIILALISIFVYKIDITKTRDWSDNYIIRDVSYNILYERRTISTEEKEKYSKIYTLYFYRDKILHDYNYDIIRIQE